MFLMMHPVSSHPPPYRRLIPIWFVGSTSMQVLFTNETFGIPRFPCRPNPTQTLFRMMMSCIPALLSLDRVNIWCSLVIEKFFSNVML